MSAPEPRSPRRGLLEPGHHGAEGAGVTLQELDSSIVEIVARRRRADAVAAAFQATFGAAPPPPGRAALAGGSALVAIAPDDWLVLGSPGAPGEAATRLATSFAGDALVADQSAGYATLRVGGQAARAALAKGCRVDLHPRAFGPLRVARSPIAQVPTILLQLDGAPRFDLLVPSPLARSFAHFLLESAAEFGCSVLPPAARDGA